MTNVDIHLLNRTYSLSCPPGREESLHQAAHCLNQELTNIQQRHPHASFEKIMMLAALSLTTQMLDTQSARNELERQLAALNQLVDNKLS